MNVLNLERIMVLEDGHYIQTLCLLLNYQVQPTKNGGRFIAGSLSFKDGSVQFKSWGNSSAFQVLSENPSMSLAYIEAQVNVYNGAKSLIVTNVEDGSAKADEIGLTAIDFMQSKYNVDSCFNMFVELLKKNVSPEAFEVVEKVLLSDIVKSRFINEYAALSRHDACVGGLLAHTLKVTQLASVLKKYRNILEHVSKDLLYVGCAIHDIGKVVEYSLGTMTPEGFMASHNSWGIELLAPHREFIIEKMGVNFYSGLISIINGHHGDFGEPPRSVAAYVIHLLDNLESTLTGLDEVLAKSPDGRVVYNDYKLN